MNKKKWLRNGILSYIFVCMAPLLLVLIHINLDSVLYASLLAAILIAVIAIFLFFSTYGTKGRVVTFCLAGVFGLCFFFGYSAGNFPSFSVAAAVSNKFPGASTWEVRHDNRSREYAGHFTGRYIYYDMEKKRFRYESVPMDKAQYTARTAYDTLRLDEVKDISVIAMYLYSEPRKAGTYYDQKSGKRYADATVRDVTIHLVDPATKTCFAEKTFTGGPKATITNTAQASSGASYASPAVRSFVLGYFK